MNLLLSVNQFHPSYLHFLEKKQNMIIDGIFSKLFYSNNHFIMNGLFIDCSFVSVYPKKYNTSTIEFDSSVNKEFIKKIMDIEKKILSHYMQFFQITHKSSIYDLSYKLQSGSLKYYSSPTTSKFAAHNSSNPEYYIKISGIWETDCQIGITYKIIEYHPK